MNTELSPSIVNNPNNKHPIQKQAEQIAPINPKETFATKMHQEKELVNQLITEFDVREEINSRQALLKEFQNKPEIQKIISEAITKLETDLKSSEPNTVSPKIEITNPKRIDIKRITCTLDTKANLISEEDKTILKKWKNNDWWEKRPALKSVIEGSSDNVIITKKEPSFEKLNKKHTIIPSSDKIKNTELVKEIPIEKINHLLKNLRPGYRLRNNKDNIEWEVNITDRINPITGKKNIQISKLDNSHKKTHTIKIISPEELLKLNDNKHIWEITKYT